MDWGKLSESPCPDKRVSTPYCPPDDLLPLTEGEHPPAERKTPSCPHCGSRGPFYHRREVLERVEVSLQADGSYLIPQEREAEELRVSFRTACNAARASDSSKRRACFPRPTAHAASE